jgi:hypothetical protein
MGTGARFFWDGPECARVTGRLGTGARSDRGWPVIPWCAGNDIDFPPALDRARWQDAVDPDNVFQLRKRLTEGRSDLRFGNNDQVNSEGEVTES